MEDQKDNSENNIDSSDESQTKRQSNTPKTKARIPKGRKGRKKAKRSAGSRKSKASSSSKQSVPNKGALPFTQRPFPRVTLEEALQVPIKIKELNGGTPWATEDLANAFELGAKANKFYYLTAGSRDFGLTLGTSRSPKIELTDLGRDIVYAPNPESEHEKKIEAFLKIDVFKKVLEYYKGSSLPDMKYLGNTLEKEFGLEPEFHEEFASLFRQNCQDLGIQAGVDGLQKDEGVDASGVTRAPATVILGELKGGGKTAPKAFVIMPFGEKSNEHPKGFFAEVLRSLITPAALEAGFIVETANKQGSDVIQSTIINDLLEADLVIADLTAHNPNVLFELGVRMAEDKPVALIKATGTGRIFDVDNMLRVFEYDTNLWLSTIEKDLPKLKEHIRAAWENRGTNQSYMKILRRGPVSTS